MSKNVTTYVCEAGTLLKSYDTFVAVKPTAELADDMVTEKFHSKTTSRHINEFFGGAEEAAKVEKVPQSDMDTFGKFVEAYTKLSKEEQIHYDYNTRNFAKRVGQ